MLFELARLCLLSVYLLYALAGVKVFANVPDYYEKPGFSSNRTVQSGHLGETIDPFHGGLQLHLNLLKVPGNGGLDIDVLLRYQSGQVQSGVVGLNHKGWPSPFGVGWDLHMGRVWIPNTQTSNMCPIASDPAESGPVLELSDGSRQLLFRDATATGYDLITKNRWVANCINSNQGYIVKSPAGLIYYFDRPSHAISQGSGLAISVSKIEDVNGNTIHIGYFTDANHELVNEIYFSNETSNKIEIFYKHYNGNSIHSNFWNLDKIRFEGQEWSFSFDHVTTGGIPDTGHYYLETINPPELGNWTLDYHNSGVGLSNLKTLATPGGTNTTYTYDGVTFDSSGTLLNMLYTTTTVVKTKTISGGNAPTGSWNYSYNPGGTSSHDKTTVIGPHGKEIYTHTGSLESNDGEVWEIGTLLKHEIFTPAGTDYNLTQTIDYIWEKDKVSDQDVRHYRRTPTTSSAKDNSVWAPRLKTKTITRDGTVYSTQLSNYDNYGNVRTLTETGSEGGSTTSKITTLAYDAKTGPWIIRLVSQESISGVSGNITRSFNSQGRLTQEQIYGVTSNYTRCSNGEVNIWTNANGKKVDHSCSQYRYGVSKSHVRGSGGSSPITITRSVLSGATISNETVGGKSTGYTWDHLNRLKTVATPRTDDDNVSITWTSTGLTRTLTRGNFQEIRSYNGLGWLTQLSAEGVNIYYQYDALGRKMFESIPGSSVVGATYKYDALDRLVEVDPPGAGKLTYDYLVGNKVRVTDQRGYQTTYEYRSYGDPTTRWLSKIIAPENVTTTINRDKLGNITSVSQGGITRVYGYNNRYQLTSITHPELGPQGDNQLHFGRDTLGNMIWKRIGNAGPQISYSYDDHNQLTQIDYPDVSTPDVLIEYNARGLVTKVNKVSQAIWDYIYNGNDILTQESLTLSIDGTQTYTMTYTLNTLDNLDALTYPSGANYDVTSNDLGQVIAINGYVNSASYHANGAVSQIQYSNGKSSTFAQNDQLLVTRAETAGAVDLDYNYDGVGNLISLINNRNGLYTYNTIGYDGLNRLKSLNGATVFNYDTKNNLTWNNLRNRNLTYSYDARNRLSNVSNSAYSFSYDIEGNVTSNGTDIFSYDQANHLTSISNLGKAYHYDGNDRRVRFTAPGGYVYAFYSQDELLKFEKMTGSVIEGSRDYLYIGKQLVARVDHCGGSDYDGDGIAGCDEAVMGLDPENGTDGIADYDGDGLNNAQELNLGTNLWNADTDSDGVGDQYEFANGYDPTNPADASTDDDADDWSLLVEYQQNTNPRNADTDNDGMIDSQDLLPNLNASIIPSIMILLN